MKEKTLHNLFSVEKLIQLDRVLMEELRKIILCRWYIWHSIKPESSPGPCTSEKLDPRKKTGSYGKTRPQEKIWLRSWKMSINISTLIIRQLCFFTSFFCRIEKASSKNRNRTLDLRKSRPLKTGPFKTKIQGGKTLQFVPCDMKDNVKKIHFHIRNRSV